tara:strand:+ start:290 stop:514 length:225 start_codon:yes stop_codon:yes gene_type:complete
MKITKDRIKEIIKEEVDNILNERRVRLPSMDLDFHTKDMVQLMGNKGRLPLTKRDAKTLLYVIRKEFGADLVWN